MNNAKIIAERQDIVSIADAIRNKTGETGELTIGEMVSSINSISNTGGSSINLDEEITAQDAVISQIQTALEGKTANTGIDTSDATATAEDIVTGKTAYVNGVKVTGSHECSGGGDASISTCTLDIYSERKVEVYCTILDGTDISNTSALTTAYLKSKQVQNVICGSYAIVVPSMDTISDAFLMIDGAEQTVWDEYFIFAIPNNDTGVVELSITDDQM